MTLPGLYVHVPFCRGKCHYCAFYSALASTHADHVRFVDRVTSAARHVAGRGYRRAATLYVGGGTPSLPAPALLDQLVSGIRSEISVVGECTIEANPATCTDAFLERAQALGFTRLSLGVQSLDAGELRLLGRSPPDLGNLRRIAARWPGALSADVIYGLPAQWSVLPTLRPLLQLGVTGISLYELAVESGTPLERTAQSGAWRMTSELTRARIYAEACETLHRAGLERYEVSSFARPGHECNHNLGYWRMHPYIGLGPSAVSTLPTGAGAERRTWPARPEAGWEDATVERLSADELAREMVMLALRTREGLSLSRFAALFGRDLAQLAAPALTRRLSLRTVRVVGDRLQATDEGLRTLNVVLADLFAEMQMHRLERPPTWEELELTESLSRW